MPYNPDKSAELYRLRADNFDEDIAPNQKQYCLEAARWLSENSFSSGEEEVEAMKQTPFYEGATAAKIKDDLQLRIKAMEDAGYEKAADIHKTRMKKFSERGNAYAFSQEWTDDCNAAAAEAETYARRKEIFGRLFSGYFEAECNPQSHHRREALKDISKALGELEAMGVAFDELAEDKVYQRLTMTTETGMKNFVSYIHKIISGEAADPDDTEDISREQAEAAAWVRNNLNRVIEAGRQEKWHRACCIAVPSDDPYGYEYIAVKEVEE